MANGIFVPPWLKGVDPGELARLHAAGMEIGQRAAAQQSQQLMAMQEAQIKQQEAAMRERIAQQEIDLQIKKQEAQVQQAQAELELKKETERREAAASAMRYAGQQKYQDVFSQLTGQGMPSDQATLEALKQSAPFMFAQAPGEAMRTVSGLLPKPPVQEFTSPSGQKYLQDPRGGIHLVPAPKTATSTRLPEVESRELQSLYQAKRELQKALTEEQANLAALEPAKEKKNVAASYASTKAQVDMLQQQLKENESRIRSFSKAPGMEPPTTKSGIVRVKDKKTGKIYRYKGSRQDVPADEYEILE